MLVYDLFYFGEFDCTVEDTDLDGVTSRWLAMFEPADRASVRVVREGGSVAFYCGGSLVGEAVPSK
jgi:hypothetical protein